MDEKPPRQLPHSDERLDNLRDWRNTLDALILNSSSSSSPVELCRMEISAQSNGHQEVALFFNGNTPSQLVLADVLEVHLAAGKRLPLVSPVLSYHQDDPRLWDYQARFSVMCTSPLPFPHQFFYSFVDAVRFELKLSRDPTSYLNWSSSLSEWMKFVHSRAYMLLAAPEPVARVASRLLDGQAVEHAMMPLSSVTPERGLAVIDIGPHWFVIENHKSSNADV